MKLKKLLTPSMQVELQRVGFGFSAGKVSLDGKVLSSEQLEKMKMFLKYDDRARSRRDWDKVLG